MENTKEGYEQKMAAQLEEWRVRIDALEARASKVDAAAKSALNEQAGELAKLQAAAKQHFDEFKSASVETWHDVKNSVEAKWSQVSAAMEKFWSKVS